MIGRGIAIVTFVPPFISNESPGPFTGVLAGAVEARHRGDDVACEAVTGTPTAVIGQPSLVVHRMLIGGRQNVIHVRTHAATSCRQHAENMATAQLSAALRHHLSEASGPSPPLPFLRSRSVIEDMLTGWLRGILGPFHGAALPVHFAHPVASRIGSPPASATSFGSSTGRPFGDLAKGAAASSLAPFVADCAASAAPRACPRRTTRSVSAGFSAIV